MLEPLEELQKNGQVLVRYHVPTDKPQFHDTSPNMFLFHSSIFYILLISAIIRTLCQNLKRKFTRRTSISKCETLNVDNLQLE